MRPASGKLKKDLYEDKFKKIQLRETLKEIKEEFVKKKTMLEKINKSINDDPDSDEIYSLVFEKQLLETDLKALKQDYLRNKDLLKKVLKRMDEKNKLAEQVIKKKQKH